MKIYEFRTFEFYMDADPPNGKKGYGGYRMPLEFLVEAECLETAFNLFKVRKPDEIKNLSHIKETLNYKEIIK